MYRLLLLFFCSFLFLAASCDDEEVMPPTEPEEPEETVLPNVILIVADDLGLTDLGIYGNPYIETPRLDALASAGILFDNAYCASPICSPSRAAIQTGYHPARIGLTEHIRGPQPVDECWPTIPPQSASRLELRFPTLGELMKGRGYRTTLVGKWHLGGELTRPTLQGYDLTYAAGFQGLPNSYFPPYFGNAFPELYDIAGGDDYLTDALTTLAISTLPEDGTGDERFFLNLNYYSPHVPIEGPADLVEKYQNLIPSGSFPEPEYAAMVEAIDRQVGRLIDELENRGLLENTIVLFTSDHGPLTVQEVPQFAAHTPPTDAGNLRGGKGYVYEGGLRVPLIAYAPERFAPAVSNEPVVLTDLYSTLARFAGSQAQSPDGQPIAALTGGTPGPRDLFFHYPHYSPQGGFPAGVLIRENQKYVEWYSDVDTTYLFDLSSDPAESRPAINAAEEEVLRAALGAWRLRVGAQEMRLNPDYLGPEECE